MPEAVRSQSCCGSCLGTWGAVGRTELPDYGILFNINRETYIVYYVVSFLELHFIIIDSLSDSLHLNVLKICYKLILEASITSPCWGMGKVEAECASGSPLFVVGRLTKLEGMGRDRAGGLLALLGTQGGPPQHRGLPPAGTPQPQPGKDRRVLAHTLDTGCVQEHEGRWGCVGR